MGSADNAPDANSDEKCNVIGPLFERQFIPSLPPVSRPAANVKKW